MIRKSGRDLKQMEPNKLSKIFRLASLKTKVSDIRGILDTYTPDNLEDTTHLNIILGNLNKWKSSLINRLEKEIKE